MSAPDERPLSAQLTTARLLLAQFELQIGEWERMGVKRRARTARGRDLGARIQGLREGHANWTARAADIVARMAEQP